MGWLGLAFGQARAVIVPGSDSKHRLVGQQRRRPAKPEPRRKARRPHFVPVPSIVRNEGVSRDIKPKDLVVFLVKRAVVFIPQTITHRKVRADLPLVLRITDIERLAHMEIAGLVRKWTQVVCIAENLDLRWSASQETLNVGERVSGASQKRVFDALGSYFHT